MTVSTTQSSDNSSSPWGVARCSKAGSGPQHEAHCLIPQCIRRKSNFSQSSASLHAFVSQKCLLSHCSPRTSSRLGSGERNQFQVISTIIVRNDMDGACTIHVQAPEDRRASKSASPEPNANGTAAVGELCGMLTKLATVYEPAAPPAGPAAEPQQQQVQASKQPQSR